MKKLVYLIILSLVFFFSCKKEDPEIANPNELLYTTYSENFICQPVIYDNNVVAVINKNNTNILCSYDSDGNTIWQQNIDGYTMNGYTFQTIDSVCLVKDKQDNLLLFMQSRIPNATPGSVSKNIQAVKFSQNGQFISLLADSIHQHDTIIIDLDTISLVKRVFNSNGFITLSNGNYAVVSSQVSATSDSTYIQLSIYNNAQFVEDSFLIIPEKRKFIDIYSTSDDHIFLAGALEGGDNFYLMMDLGGNILFEVPTQGLTDTYFFFENSDGNYIVSTSYIDRGVVFCINNLGQEIWMNSNNFSPTWIMLSVQEQSDGYVFCGFNTVSLLSTGIDWRTSFLQEEHHAVIQKTNFAGTEQWQLNMPGNYFSAGAATIGSSPISFYGGKYDQSSHSVYILKLNDDGTIPN